MEKIIRDNIFQQAIKWIYEASSMIREKMNDPLHIETKSNPNDLVTEIDQATEKFFVNKIRSTYPNHFILGEEGFGDSLDNLTGTVWIIDPIDGTTNFVHQKSNFAISIGIYYNGVGEIGLIYDVKRDVLYHAKKGEGAYKNKVKLTPLKRDLTLEKSIIGMNHFWLCHNRLVDEKVMEKFVRTVRGTRSYGSAALEFAYIAEGILDAYLTLNLAPWDIAAGIVIVNEVGGVTTTIDGESVHMLKQSPILTCNPAIQEIIIKNYITKGRKVT
ncbi:inositol monophosphatase family protein [Cerasibacillus terrae]|uniref:inositol-phosphate phosphatase n=1 Tax=Cerasibacillus terrae TaxID=2498845 RepID=A0A5C8P1S8_9BACI|nr:inositol monophosphatase family protein [Cerasibacillus terrae]TXL67560.1 inositol monophosphatase family protein [Cerasibacillus terrae]